ncbi:MAG: hypothetical protein V4751_04900 [Pseudomonadota bacterium]
MLKLYIERQIRLGDEVVSEAELLRRSRLIIVLAEPGAGKSDLLSALAEKLGTRNIKAARFRTETYVPVKGSLVIDAMDEVARLGECQLNDIVEKASANHKGTVIFASRSSEWEKARTSFVEDCFGLKPDVAHLEAFNIDEQKRLFGSLYPSESFDSFAAEVHRLDLSPLLGNPEFLKLFGLAYQERKGRFSSKVQIYSDAALRLAQESNDGRSARRRPEASEIVAQAGSVFARLLLSGASGVSVKERIGDRDFPYAKAVDGEVDGDFTDLLDSRLFKPSIDENEHEPIHRIVAEYLAAQYLARRIGDPADRLSEKRCLSIVAPNNVVRDELRGLLGWLASLGGDAIQKAAIAIDPYAVLANGDPAQLLPKNKLLLIESLQRFAETDPYFRRSDEWRSFNVGQFFSDETIAALRPVLAGREETHLRGLILELINGTSIVEKLDADLIALTLDAKANDSERLAAVNLLLDLEKFDPFNVVDALLAEGSATAMQILTRGVLKRGVVGLASQKVIELLCSLATLYPASMRGRHRDGLSRYFIKVFFRQFPADGIAEYLDELSASIQCTCCPKNAYACECRHGISKIVGGLLDRHFEVEVRPHNPARVWNWIRNLHFPHSITVESSASVRVLSEDHELRQAIQRIALSAGNTFEECTEIERDLFSSHAHAGLLFKAEDIGVAVQHAFDQGLAPLWEALWRSHNWGRPSKGPDEQRTTMRAQSRKKAELMQAWARRDRAAKRSWRENRRFFAGRAKRYAKREASVKASNFAYLRDNREQIEAGQHWGWLEILAYNYLYESEKFKDVVDDVETAFRALRNCFPFLADHVPTLEQLARGEWINIAMVLHAACVLHWRENGALEGIAANVLRAVKTVCGECNGIEHEEAVAFDAEVNRLLFQGAGEIKQFAIEYIEPSLSLSDEAPTNVAWLEYKSPFQELQATLPIEWLQRFPKMPRHAETSLFKMAARSRPSAEIRALIACRVEQYLPEPALGSTQSFIDRRNYWLMNSFFHDDDERVWDVLKGDKNTLLGIASLNSRFRHDDETETPSLPADKLYKVLDAFVDEWPEVELPSSYGTGDPPGETAYRFMREIPWRIGRDDPQMALAVLDKLLNDNRFASYRSDLLAVRATVVRKAAHRDYRAPSPAEISALLEKRSVASVEDLRALMVEVLTEAEAQIRHSETDKLSTYYVGDKHVIENTARNRIVDELRSYMIAQRLSVAIEHHMAQSTRCDITVAEMIEGRRRLLVIEVKGQWHLELFTAAAEQLDTRYASHPDAEQQGIYLVLWFGQNEKVEGRKNTKYKTPEGLRVALVNAMPLELHGRIDVVVIDLSRNS